MAIRKVLVPLTGTAAGEAALITALLAARHWNAHLTALHVRADSRDIAHMAGEGLSGAMIEEMMGAADRENARRTAKLREMFERIVSAHGVGFGSAIPNQPEATAEFDIVTGREDDRVAQLARLADVTVVQNPASTVDGSSSDMLHAALFDSGRPVLIAPLRAPATLGTHVCLAWSGAAESAAAARYAIPWMQMAARVTILSADSYRRPGPTATELAGYLALHDVSTVQASFEPIDKEVGAGMLAAAHAAGGDMLVMGAYHSSRLRQFILGGVTRYVLENADMPVLMCR